MLDIKKNGNLWFRVFCQQLNNKDCVFLLRIDDPLDTPTGVQCFLALDLKNGYWQTAHHHSDNEKTAFCSGQGLLQFTVIPFDL
jgi:hypothetical protein